jgi:hypothetical protein
VLRCGPGCVARVLVARQIRSRHRWRTPHGGTSSRGPPGEGTAFLRQRPLGQHGATRNPAYVAAATPSPPCIRTAPSFMRIALVRSGGGVRWVLRVSSGSSLSSNRSRCGMITLFDTIAKSREVQPAGRGQSTGRIRSRSPTIQLLGQFLQDLHLSRKRFARSRPLHDDIRDAGFGESARRVEERRRRLEDAAHGRAADQQPGHRRRVAADLHTGWSMSAFQTLRVWS